MPTPSRIIQAVRRYNRWRRGDEKLKTPCPTRTGKELDALCDLAERQQAEIEKLRSQLSTVPSQPSP